MLKPSCGRRRFVVIHHASSSSVVLLLLCRIIFICWTTPGTVTAFALSSSSLLATPAASSFKGDHSSGRKSSSSCSSSNNILILDHWNINHEKGRQDWLLTFYVDFLKCALDPRKLDNLEDPDRRERAGLSSLSPSDKKRTVWANIGAHQFHLPQGNPDAQVLDGVITLVYEDLKPLLERYPMVAPSLKDSMFQMETKEDGSVLKVTDPWGSRFLLVEGNGRDSRGLQPGEPSEGLALRDLTIHTPPGANLPGIGRFYQQILGAHLVEDTTGSRPTGNKNKHEDDCVQIQVGPQQTLTFRPCPSTTPTSHVDLRDEPVEIPDGVPAYLSNHGPHISMYVADLAATYQRAADLGVIYVNPRFSRRAYSLQESLKDCMFRCLDIVDPEDVESGPILQLEHEIRSVVRVDGTKYKSCPFDEIPPECTR